MNMCWKFEWRAYQAYRRVFHNNLYFYLFVTSYLGLFKNIIVVDTQFYTGILLHCLCILKAITMNKKQKSK